MASCNNDRFLVAGARICTYWGELQDYIEGERETHLPLALNTHEPLVTIATMVQSLWQQLSIIYCYQFE
jgi:hypothetical protein